jgi:GTP pyrophosphokinase
MISAKEKTKIKEKYRLLLEASEGIIQDDEHDQLEHAFTFARTIYGNKQGTTGELMICHSLQIARMALDEMGLGTASLIAALLHDAVMKGYTTLADLEKTFGPQAGKLVDGFSKLSDLPTDKVSLQSESFRKLFVALVDDIRVILLKLVHRLYDMRNIERLPKNLQARFHAEVIHIYIPIAHRLGLYRIKKELEELSMKYTQPEIYTEIKQKIKDTEPKRKVFIDEFISPIQRELIAQGFDFDIIGRPKSIPSIWNKMKKQDVEFEQVYDLFAIRIILKSSMEHEKAECWRAYSIVTNIYQPNPKRLRDWISTPKASGYESLHTTVKGPGNRWVEVQIRTARMNEIAEKGQAAHWRYKGFGSKRDADEWLGQVRDIIEHPDQINFDDIDSSYIQKPNDKVFVFTPTGDLKELRVGATVLDFAFEVHTSVGLSCTGARVNNKLVPIKQVLNNGDKVEILTSKVQRPKYDWMNFVITSKAKNKIKRALKEDEYLQAEKGNEILRRKFRNWKVAFNDASIDKLLKKYKLNSSITLYGQVCQEKIDLVEMKRFLTKGDQKEEKADTRVEQPAQKTAPVSTDRSGDMLFIDQKLDKVNYHLAKCCNPIPGDPVFGFVTVSRGISIHKKSCPNARQLLSRFGYRQMDVKWKKTESSSAFPATIKVVGNDKLGVMNDISQVISNELKVNMVSVKMDVRNGIFTGVIKIIVHSTKHLTEVLRRVSKIPGVDKAIRAD